MLITKDKSTLLGGQQNTYFPFSNILLITLVSYTQLIISKKPYYSILNSTYPPYQQLNRALN